MLIADCYNHRIRKVTVSTGIITSIAGTGASGYSGDGGAATSTTLYYPRGVALDASGRCLLQYFTPILLLFLLGITTNLLTLSSLGNVYLADCYNHRIRKVTVSTGIISTIAGTGTSSYSGDGGAATSATFYYPHGVALDASGRI